MIIVKNRKFPELANCKETYTGRQCVDNEEAERTFTFLEGQMNTFLNALARCVEKLHIQFLHHHGQQFFHQRIKSFVFYYLCSK